MTAPSFFERVSRAWRYVIGSASTLHPSSQEPSPPGHNHASSKSPTERQPSTIFTDEPLSLVEDDYDGGNIGACNAISYQFNNTQHRQAAPTALIPNVGFPDEGYALETHELTSVIHEVYGNTYDGTLEQGAVYNQVFNQMPANIPSCGPLPEIKLHGRRARNVIGRVVGNVNSADIPAGATFNQEFMPDRAYAVPGTYGSCASRGGSTEIEPSEYGYSMVYSSNARSPSMPMPRRGHTLGQPPANRYNSRHY